VFNANSVHNYCFPFPVSHRIQTDYIVCVTSDPPQYHIIKHFFAQDICSPCCSTICTYIHVPTVSLCEIPYHRIGGSCEYEQRKVNCLVGKCTELYFIEQLYNFLCQHYVCIYVIWVTNICVQSVTVPTFKDCCTLQADQKQ
jgi:hypothetical protein